jgi:formate--tetrahydrofolate ligase
LRDAVKPNLVQTLEGTPALVHGGPFANIAHGCSSVIATQAGMKLADYVVTEAGFGADLGAEKFVDIKCRESGLRPHCAVVVATIRALKYHGGAALATLDREDLGALQAGLPNLLRHVSNLTEGFGLRCVVALNHRTHDTDAEVALLREQLAAAGTGHRAAPAPSIWRMRSSPPPTRPARCASSTRTTCRCWRNSRRWHGASTAPRR